MLSRFRWSLVPAVLVLGCSTTEPAPATPRRPGTGVDGGTASGDGGSSASADGATPPGQDANAPPTGGDGGGTLPDGAPAPHGPLLAYASGYGTSIQRFAVDETTGALTSKGSTTSFGASPSFLAINAAATNLYAVDENDNAGKVGAYTIDPKTGALTFLAAVSSGGKGPAFVGIDRSGKYVLVANYTDGGIAVLPVQAGGALGAAVDSRNAGANAHMMVADPSNHFVFVPCLGSDYVAQYTFDAGTGKLTPNATAHVSTDAGAGPRHLAFHPGGKLAYLINEKSSTLTAFTLDTTAGTLAPIETKSTLPAGFTGTNTGAEVWVHPSGKWVVASNRGDDSLAVFSIDAGTGKMTLVGHTKTGGATPRDFSFDPSGAFVYAANQDGNNVVPFRFDGATAALTSAGASVPVTMATFVGIVRLPAP